MLDIKPLTLETLPELKQLFCSDRSTESCWCMWFIIRVKDFHDGGAPANEAWFKSLAESSTHPLGLIAVQDRQPVGWIAVGPRSRYARAVHTPTMKSIDHSDNDDVWLAPCFFVHPNKRRDGIARALLESAVDLARRSGATAIEGFPTAGSKMRSADRQVGTERLFKTCHFRAVDRPSSNRVLMRLELTPRGGPVPDGRGR